MRVLLINPREERISQTNSPMEVERHTGLFYPLNMRYSAPYRNSLGSHKAAFLYMNIYEEGRLKLIQTLFDADIDTTGAVSPSLLSALDIGKHPKKYRPELKSIPGSTVSFLLQSLLHLEFYLTRSPVLLYKKISIAFRGGKLFRCEGNIRG